MAKFTNFMNSIRVKTPKRSVFDLSHTANISCNMGQLVPSCFFDVVPGDKIKVDTQALVRMMPMLAPMYSKVNCYFHTFFVPYRILWPNWEKYITQIDDPLLPPPVFPYISVIKDGSNYTRLMDHFGIPDPTPIATVNKNDELISAMRFAAYQCCFDTKYRNQRIMPDRIPFQLVDGNNSANLELTKLRNRNWGADYFTSCTPEPQYGDPVDMPIVIEDSVVRRGADPALGTPPGQATSDMAVSNVSFPTSGGFVKVDNQLSGDPLIDTGEQLYADNSTANASTTINDFRLSVLLQRFKERLNVAGNRLVEYYRAFYGTILPDFTAQNPIFLGGSKTPIQISEVLNTTGIAGELPQGNMSGRGIGVNEGYSEYYEVLEHGVCLTIMSIMPETGYLNGIEREYSKISSPFDFLLPMFDGLGEQEVQYRELFAFGIDPAAGTTTADTFGYNVKYAEYRTIPNRATGQFRSTLTNWHMYRDFYNPSITPQPTPMLNEEFILADPTHRIFADTDPNNDKLLVSCYNKVRAVRPLSVYGTPGLMAI